MSNCENREAPGGVDTVRATPPGARAATGPAQPPPQPLPPIQPQPEPPGPKPAPAPMA